MRILSFVPAAAFFCAAALAAVPAPTEALNHLPAWFEPSPGGAAFTSRGASITVQVDRHGATLAADPAAIRLAFPGSSPASSLQGLDAQQGVTNYLHGNRRQDWRQNIPHYSRIAARDLYPGIDAIYYTAGKHLEYDFVVAPGADPRQIRLQFRGASRPRLESDGGLTLTAGSFTLAHHAPVVYQERAGVRTFVDARYRVARNGEVRFDLGSYDKSLPLVIDPVVSYAGYLGGSLPDVINAAVAASDGGFWVAGASRSQVGIPEGSNPYQTTNKGSRDAFLAKIMPDGGSWRLAEWTFIGGAGDDQATAIAYDGVHVAFAGTTKSTDFPLGGNAFQTGNNGGTDAFVGIYDPTVTGTDTLFYCSYYGGPDTETAQAVAIDSRLNVTVVGYTNSGTLQGAAQGTALQPSNRGGLDAFVFTVQPLNPASSALIFSTFLGGNSTDLANAVAVDKDGMIYVAGTTMSDDFPLAGASYQAYPRSTGDVFLVKLNPTKTGFDSLLYATYFGGSDLDTAEAIVLDNQNRAWITGYTFSQDLPVTPGALQLGNAGSADAFVARLDPSKGGADFVSYCSYFGGSGADVPYAIALNGATGVVTVAGYSTSRDFPAKNMPDYAQPPIKTTEAFAASIDPSKTGADALLWATLFGGNYTDVATGVALDADGNPFVAGFTTSPNLPVGNTPGKPSGSGYYSGFFFKLK